MKLWRLADREGGSEDTQEEKKMKLIFICADS